jgi:uncharacterized membrane protein YqjE
MGDAPPTEGGIFSTVTRLFQTLHDLAQSRLELFLVELKEERLRLFDALFLFAIGIVFAVMTLVLVTLTVIVIFWDTHRMLVLTLLTMAYGVAAMVTIVKLRSRLQHWRAFSATLEQLKKDRACFKPPN